MREKTTAFLDDLSKWDDGGMVNLHPSKFKPLLDLARLALGQDKLIETLFRQDAHELHGEFREIEDSLPEPT